jgi:nucleoid-associated protein YgaU
VRWLLLPPASDSMSVQDLVTYRFRPQVQKESQWAPPSSATVTGLEDQDVSVVAEAAKALVDSPEKPLASNSRVVDKYVFAVSRVLQVKTTDHTKYVVESGDRLDKISKKFYGTYQRYREILKANPGLNSRSLRPGMIIKIPEAPQGLPVNSLAYVSEPQEKASTHVIQPGDTLGEIAQRKLGSTKWVSKILDINPGLKPSRLKVGQKIKLPSVAVASH